MLGLACLLLLLVTGPKSSSDGGGGRRGGGRRGGGCCMSWIGWSCSSSVTASSWSSPPVSAGGFGEREVYQLLSRWGYLCRHLVITSFLLFRLLSSLQVAIIVFSVKHRLQLLPPLCKGLAKLLVVQVML